MAGKYAKEDAEDEEKVYDVSSKVAHFSRSNNLGVAHSTASHPHSNEELAVVEDQETKGHDDRGKEFICMLLVLQIEAAGQTWISLYVEVVVAVENHEVGNKHEEEQAQVNLGDLIHSLTCKDTFLDAAPVCWSSPWTETCQFTKPVDQDSSDEDRSCQLSECIGHEAGLVDMDWVKGIIEDEEQECQGQRASLLKGKLLFQTFRDATEYFGAIEDKNYHTQACEKDAEI